MIVSFLERFRCSPICVLVGSFEQYASALHVQYVTVQATVILKIKLILISHDYQLNLIN